MKILNRYLVIAYVLFSIDLDGSSMGCLKYSLYYTIDFLNINKTKCVYLYYAGRFYTDKV